MSTDSKMSDSFRERIARLDPAESVRAVVVLFAHAAPDVLVRQSLEERRAAVAVVRAAGVSALPQIDRVLVQFGGRRVSASASAVRTLLVDATPAALHALSALPEVEAILENQPLTALS